MWDGFEEKTTEDKLRERVAELEIENRNLKMKKETLVEQIKILEDTNTSIKEKNITLEKLRQCSNQIIGLQKMLLDDDKNREVVLEDFLSRQQRIFQNKVNHGFNTTNIYQEARYILEEVTELMRAIEKNDRENMIEELADIIIFTYGCAEVARLGDLDKKIFEKMAINEKREYKQTDEGDFVKTGGQLNG